MDLHNKNVDPRGNGVPDAPGNSRIRDAVSYLEGQMEHLHALISSLTNRLDTALVPQPPQQPVASTARVAGNPAGGPPPSHVQERLQGLATQLEDAHLRLNDLMARIEL